MRFRQLLNGAFQATGVLAVSATAAAATVLVVDPGGGGDFTDIQSAVNSAQDGDTVRVLAGIYEGPVTLGTVATHLTLSCEAPHLVTIRNEMGNSITVGTNATVTIEGCTVSGGGSGIVLRAGSRTRVLNCIISHNSQDGIANFEDGVVSLLVRNSTIVTNHWRGIHMLNFSDTQSPPNAIERWAVESSIIAANGNCGLLRARASSLHPLPPMPSVAYNNVHQNSPDYCTVDVGAFSLSTLPGFVNQAANDLRLRSDAASRNQGNPSAADNDPDGTRNDQGAYGGPGAAGFFPSPEHGPIVPFLHIDRGAVGQGEPLRLRATGREAK